MLIYMVWVPNCGRDDWHGLVHGGTFPVWGRSRTELMEKLRPMWEEELRNGRATLVVYDTEANTLEDV